MWQSTWRSTNTNIKIFAADLQAFEVNIKEVSDYIKYI